MRHRPDRHSIHEFRAVQNSATIVNVRISSDRAKSIAMSLLRGLTILLPILLLLPIMSAGNAAAEKRAALIVGNSAYQNVRKLRNPANDSDAIAKLFRDAGFDIVEARQDLGVDDLRRAIRNFAVAARDASVAVVFYAGHGIEVDGTNYIIPVDAKLEWDIDIEDQAVSLDRVLKSIETAKQLRLVILDACRDNPFLVSMKRTTATRSIGRGLAKVEPAITNTLIAFAAKDRICC
jgi:uncharacterized caspase-like protein